jgi:hypothetical protein
VSLHLMECVRPLRLNPSTKLALLAFADSADSATQIAFPGLEAVMEWASVSRSRAAAVVAELVDAGLLRHHRPGHRGRRAEYVVFPGGCCDAHPRPRVDDDNEPTYPRSVTPSGRPSWAPPLPTADGTQTAEKGSCAQDSVSVKASRGQDPIATTPADRVLPAAPSRRKGSCLDTAHGTPSLTTTTTPQPPPAPPAGEPNQPACAAHGPIPGPNCRTCGTSPRAASRVAAAAAATRARDDRLAAQAARAAAAAAPPRPRSAATTAVVAATRRTLKGARP